MLKGVKSVVELRREAQKAEWYVGRAYSLIEEVRFIQRDNTRMASFGCVYYK